MVLSPYESDEAPACASMIGAPDRVRWDRADQRSDPPGGLGAHGGCPGRGVQRRARSGRCHGWGGPCRPLRRSRVV